MRRDSADSEIKDLPGKKRMSWPTSCLVMTTIAVMFPLLAACNSVEQTYSEFFEEEPMPERVQEDEKELEGGSIPNLSTVPMERPTPTPEQEREKLRRSLQDDHSGAGIEQQADPQSTDPPDDDEMGSDNTSSLDGQTGNTLAGNFVSSALDSKGVQLARMAWNQGMIDGHE